MHRFNQGFRELKRREEIMKRFDFLFVSWVSVIVLLTASTNSFAVVDRVEHVTSGTAASAVVQYVVKSRSTGGVIGACSGGLISPSWALMIAHCIDRYSDRRDINDRDVYLPVETDDLGENTDPYVVITDPYAPDPAAGDIEIKVDRVVRVDGDQNSPMTNSLALVHLEQPVPLWVETLPLYRGNVPDSAVRLELWGYGGWRGRSLGFVNVASAWWQAADKFWALGLNPVPSSIEGGDSGGPILIANNGRKELAAVNWGNHGGAAGDAAAAFDISNGNTNPVSHLIDRLVHEPMGHGAKILDVEGDGMNEIVLYDSHSGELRLLGIGDYTRFNVRLTEQLPPKYQFVEVGDFDGNGRVNELVLYRGDTGELRAYKFIYTGGDYYLAPWRRYTPYMNPLIPCSVAPLSPAATTSGNYDNNRNTTELAIIDKKNHVVHVVNVDTGEYLGFTQDPYSILGLGQIFASGEFGAGGGKDSLAVAVYLPSQRMSGVVFADPTVTATGKVVFAWKMHILLSLGRIAQMVTGNYDDTGNDDLFFYRADNLRPNTVFAEVYTDVISSPSRLMVQTLSGPFNMIAPGNFDGDDYDEIAMWQRAANTTQQGMSVYSIDGSSNFIRLSGRVWNWQNRWWTAMQ
ncbi:MAG: hypothetical protein AVO38_07120 [delta proteobacterium ML8_D]|nr:MAG: hypothetical protein AVO38_07120 [delta proteobacterium ML8_D]